MKYGNNKASAQKTPAEQFCYSVVQFRSLIPLPDKSAPLPILFAERNTADRQNAPAKTNRITAAARVRWTDAEKQARISAQT